MSASKLPTKKVHRLYQCPVFRAKVHVLLGYAEAEVIKKFNLTPEDRDDHDRGVSGWVMSLPKGRLAIWIGPHDNAYELRDTIVHETNHLARFVLEGVGITLGAETQEAYAYYQTFWFNHISDMIWGRGK